MINDWVVINVSKNYNDIENIYLFENKIQIYDTYEKLKNIFARGQIRGHKDVVLHI